MSGLQTIQRAEPSIGEVAPIKQHIVDKQRRGTGPIVEGEPELAPKTLCGEDWDVLNRPVAGQMCEECLDVVRARGDGHLIQAILAGGGRK